MRTLILKKPNVDKLIYLLFLLAVFNLYLAGAYILLVCFFLLVFEKKKISIDRVSFLLILFAAVYAVFSYASGYRGLATSLQVVVFPIAYCLGRNLKLDPGENYLRKIIIQIAVFMAMHMVLNLCYNLYLTSFDIYSHNRFRDIFSGEISASTGQATYAYFFCSILCYLFFGKYGAMRNLMIVVMYTALLLYNFALGGRSFIFLSVMSITIGGLYYMIRKKRIAMLMKFLIPLSAAAVLIAVFYSMNIFGWRERFEASYFYYRFFGNTAFTQSIFENSRMAIQMDFIRNMFDYPLGGGKISQIVGNYAHNLWLDVYDGGGILAFLLIVFYTIASVSRMYRYIRFHDMSPENAMMLMSFLICNVSMFFVEPIVSGAPMFFVAYCFVDGAFSRFGMEAECTVQRAVKESPV